MDYSKIYRIKRKGDNMSNKKNNEKKAKNTQTTKNTQSKKETINKEVKKENIVKDTHKKEKIKQQPKEEFQLEISPKIEKIFCLIIALIFVVLAILSFSIKELIPATLITLSLELFSLSYFTKEKNGTEKRVYLLFFAGVSILLISVFYTIIHTI